MNTLNTSRGDYRWIILLLFLQWPAMRTFYKFVPEQYQLFIPLIMLSFGLIFWSYFNGSYLSRQLASILESKGLLIGIGLVVLIISYFGFGYERQLQIFSGFRDHGSDSANCLVVSGVNFVHGNYLYKDLTEYGNPISPGPGWVILNLPFVAWGYNAYFLLTPFWLLLCALAIGWYREHVYYANLFLIIMMSSFAFWELLCTGVDHVAIGCAFALCLILLERVISQGKRGQFVLLILLAGALGTSRVAFFFFPPLLGFLVMHRNWQQGLLFGVLGFLVTLSLHAIFYFPHPALYQPLHLLSKSSHLMPGYFKLLPLLACVLVGVWVIKRAGTSLSNWLWICWICIITPLVFVALGDLIYWRHWDVRLWEGANYITATLPVLVAWFTIAQPLRVLSRNLKSAENPEATSIVG